MFPSLLTLWFTYFVWVISQVNHLQRELVVLTFEFKLNTFWRTLYGIHDSIQDSLSIVARYEVRTNVEQQNVNTKIVDMELFSKTNYPAIYNALTFKLIQFQKINRRCASFSFVARSPLDLVLACRTIYHEISALVRCAVDGRFAFNPRKDTLRNYATIHRCCSIVRLRIHLKTNIKQEPRIVLLDSKKELGFDFAHLKTL